jgi:hypothetical protein
MPSPKERELSRAPAALSGDGHGVDLEADTRQLSELRLLVGGCPPVLRSSTMVSGHYAVIGATNPWLRDRRRLAGGSCVTPARRR